MLMLQQRPDPRRTRLEELLADGTVARLALNLGELLGDEKDSDVRPRSGTPALVRPVAGHSSTNTAACVMLQEGGVAAVSCLQPVIQLDPFPTDRL